MHCKLDRDLFVANLHSDESDGCSVPVDVIVPFVVVAASVGEFSVLLGDKAALLIMVELLRVIMRRFKSSLRRLFSGDTFINELKLLDVAD